MRTRTLLLVFGLLLALALAASACGSAAAPAAPAPAQSGASQASAPTAAPASQGAANTAGQEPVELRIAWWGSQDRHDRTIKAIDAFQKKYPNIKVTYEFAGWDDYWTKMTTEAAGNSLPDVMQQDYAYIDEWYSRGLISALDDQVKAGNINLADVPDAYLQGGKIKDKLVALNAGSNTQNIAIDVDAFKKAGVDIPKDNWTWADFEKTATTLHDKLGIWGMGDDLANDQMWKNVYFTNGQWAYSDDGTKLGYTDDKPLVGLLSLIQRLEKSGTMPSRQEEVAQYRGKSVEAKAGVAAKAAMDYFNSNQLVAYWKAAGDNRNFKLLPLPRAEGGKSSNYIKPSMFWSITSQSKHPKEAALWLDFYTNDLAANEILGAERGVPVSTKVQDALKPKLSKAQAETFDFLSRVSKDVQPIKPPDPKGHPDIVKNVWVPQVADPVLYGQITPEQGAALMRTEATKILESNKK
ncbi:MAG: extracellular solute-binding protein [Anaerolineae bacterium]